MRKVGVVLMALVAVSVPAQENLPAGPGQTLVLEACVQCHDVRELLTQDKSEAEWRRTVNEMIWRGAPLMPGEAAVVTKYLASWRTAPRAVQTFTERPESQLPAGPGRALVIGACVRCHDLAVTVTQRKTPVQWHRTVEQMARLGASLNGDEFRVVASYLARAFPAEARTP